MHKANWLAYIIRARHGVVHKGDRHVLEEEITAAILEHLWTRHQGPRRYQRLSDHPTYATTLAPFNLARWQKQADLELDQEPVGIGDRRYID